MKIQITHEYSHTLLGYYYYVYVDDHCMWCGKDLEEARLIVRGYKETGKSSRIVEEYEI